MKKEAFIIRVMTYSIINKRLLNGNSDIYCTFVLKIKMSIYKMPVFGE